MSRLPLQTIESAPEASRPFLEKALANNGFLPNLLASLANAPVALETYLTVAGINGRSGLTLAERETDLLRPITPPLHPGGASRAKWEEWPYHVVRQRPVVVLLRSASFDSANIVIRCRIQLSNS